MAILLFLISAILFIATFGIHATLTTQYKWATPIYTKNPLTSSIPWISGFILPVIPLSLAFEVSWIVFLVLNFGIVWFFGPLFTKEFLTRFASGKGLEYDIYVSFFGGLVTLILGILIKF